MDQKEYSDILFKKDDDMTEYEKSIYKFPRASKTLSKIETEEKIIQREIMIKLDQVKMYIDKAVLTNNRGITVVYDYSTERNKKVIDEVVSILTYLGYKVGTKKSITKGWDNSTETRSIIIEW